ncbi:MAG: histidinol dehydrogenase, partial [Pseudomonadota bacterium]
LKYTAEFDQVHLSAASGLEISKAQLQQALDSLPADQRSALAKAAERIREFHLLQKQASWAHTDSVGNRLGQRITAIDRAGLYVPGGKAHYCY